MTNLFGGEVGMTNLFGGEVGDDKFVWGEVGDDKFVWGRRRYCKSLRSFIPSLTCHRQVSCSG
jgi:hypothetical protein